MSDTARAPLPHEDEHIDGCGCGRAFRDGDAIDDAALPSATGGVANAHAAHVDENHVDGCDIDFAETDGTPDARLPVTIGGVA